MDKSEVKNTNINPMPTSEDIVLITPGLWEDIVETKAQKTNCTSIQVALNSITLGQ